MVFLAEAPKEEEKKVEEAVEPRAIREAVAVAKALAPKPTVPYYYAPVTAPIQPTPPPKPTAPTPTQPPPIQQISWAYAGYEKPPPEPTVKPVRVRPGKVPIERREIERLRERARKYPERVWKPPTFGEIARGFGEVARGYREARIEDVLVPPQMRRPKTVRALERFVGLEKKVARVPGIIGVKYGPRGARIVVKKPLVEAIQPLKFPLGMVAEVEQYAHPGVPTVSGALWETGAYALTHGGRFPSKEAYEKYLMREEKKAWAEFSEALTAEETRAKREYGAMFSPKAAREWRKQEEAKFRTRFSRWRKEQLAEYKAPLEEVGELGPWYWAGSLAGAFITGTAFAKGAGKVWKGITKITPIRIKAPISEVAKFGRVAKLVHKAKVKIITTEPVYSIRRAWRWIRTPSQPAKTAIERGIVWGEEKFLMPSGFELSETLRPAYKWTGFPVIYGKKAAYGVIQVSPATALTRIQKWIERGMFPRMGTLSAQQVVVAKKAVPLGFPTAGVAFERVGVTAPARVAGVLPFVLLGVARRRRVVARKPAEKPRVRRRMTALARHMQAYARGAAVPVLVPKFAEPTLERAMQKFRPQALLRLEPKQREKAVPVVVPTLAYALERQKFWPQQLLQRPKVPEREKVFPVPKIVFEPVAVPKLVPTTRPKLVPRQVLVPSFPWFAPTVPARPVPVRPPLLPLRGRVDVGRRGRRRRGAWYLRVHPIPKPREFMAGLLGKPKQISLKPRRKKGKKRRKRRGIFYIW